MGDNGDLHKSAGGSRTHDGGFAIRCLSHLATVPSRLPIVSDTTPAGRYRSRQNRQTLPRQWHHTRRPHAWEGAGGSCVSAEDFLPGDSMFNTAFSPPFPPNRPDAGVAMNSIYLPESVLRLFPWRRRRLVAQMGGELARQCRADLWHRVCGLACGMSLAELRGYARAQAAALVAAEAEDALGRCRLRQPLRERVVAAGVDQAVSMAVRDARAPRRQTP